MMTFRCWFLKCSFFAGPSLSGAQNEIDFLEYRLLTLLVISVIRLTAVSFDREKKCACSSHRLEHMGPWLKAEVNQGWLTTYPHHWCKHRVTAPACLIESVFERRLDITSMMLYPNSETWFPHAAG